MPSYKELDIEEGFRFFRNVWNLIPKPLEERDFFVEPWANRELADCAEFRSVLGETMSHSAFFFVADEVLVHTLEKTTGEFFLFGAYNQINVCQMRALGTVTAAEGHPEAEQINYRLREAIRSRVGAKSNRLSEDEAEIRAAILDNGSLFHFQFSSFAYSMYDRG